MKKRLSILVFVITIGFTLFVNQISFAEPWINFRDNFSDGVFDGWTVVEDEDAIHDQPAVWHIVNEELVQESNIWGGPQDGLDPERPGTFAYCDAGLGWTDYYVNINLKSTDDDSIGVIFRYKDPENYYHFFMDRERSYRKLVKKVDGVVRVLAEDDFTYNENQWYNLKLLLEGDSLQISFDGLLLFDLIDSSLSYGSIAPFSCGNAGSYFDNVIAYNIDETPPVLISVRTVSFNKL